MRRSLPASLALLVSLLASPALGGGFDLSVHYGGDQYNAVGLKRGLGGLSSSSRLKDFSTHVGATGIHRAGVLDLGAIAEIGRPGQHGSTSLLGALGGLGIDAGPLRLEALGELGAHRYGDLLRDSRVVTRSKSETWLVSAGVRPGISIRFGPSDRLLVGVWGFARWDVTHENVNVTLGNAEQSTYKVGGVQYGASLRLGVRL